MTYQWTSTNAIDQKPWDERSDEEPRLEVPAHERRHMGVEADRLLKQSAVYQSLHTRDWENLCTYVPE